MILAPSRENQITTSGYKECDVWTRYCHAYWFTKTRSTSAYCSQGNLSKARTVQMQHLRLYPSIRVWQPRPITSLCELSHHRTEKRGPARACFKAPIFLVAIPCNMIATHIEGLFRLSTMVPISVGTCLLKTSTPNPAEHARLSRTSET